MVRTVMGLLVKSMLKDAYVLVWSILLPLGLFIGVGLYSGSPAYREQLLVGCLLMSILMGAINTAGFWIMTQRRSGVFKLLKLSLFPISRFILCTMLARLLIFEVITLLLLAAGVVCFGMRISLTGTVVLMAVTLISLICFHAIGYMIASRASNEGAMNMASSAVTFPLMFASTSFYSLDGAPQWIRFLSRLNPVEYAAVLGRGAVTGDVPIQELWMFIAFAVICSAGAVKTFRYE
ncbi:ABC-2 type transport system permease protein [Paenibacillus mucilaginosus]|uniref:ABC transporter permease n=1 Tax=Paenibacillus mucilaginosus TaxID=61624 RepID=UPI003D1C6709